MDYDEEYEALVEDAEEWYQDYMEKKFRAEGGYDYQDEEGMN